eukprot:TRINITY_DN3363_c0_g1_i2.p1 TRINITY_DN3363_c0_g1~~TRINITY_DN3363_c0_g1_i2.p1  ORF type:complete len:221 (-),score=38.87 TRINITY_DN3363_c0_g1_i2:16-678(-)
MYGTQTTKTGLDKVHYEAATDVFTDTSFLLWFFGLLHASDCIRMLHSIDRYVLPLYTIGCNVVLLCYDMTSSESFNELQFFLDFLDKENKWGGVLYAFVGLKSDLEGQRRVHQYQVKELANSNQFNASFFEVSSVDPKDNSVEEMFLAVARKWLEAQGCELQDTLVSILCCSIAKDVDKSFGGLETLKATLPHELYLRIEKSITRHIEEDEQEALTPLYD